MSAHAMHTERFLERENIFLSEGAGSGIWKGLTGLGLLLTALAVVAGFTGGEMGAKIALHALHTGFSLSVMLPVTALGFVMILNVVKAGWSATIRRQLENMMTLMWVPAIMFVGILVLQFVLSGSVDVEAKYAPYLWEWMNPAYVEGDSLYDHKAVFLNVPFFLIRALVYFGLWAVLSFLLSSESFGQDADGDKWRTVNALKISAIGLPFFAFATAFAGFDWLMTLDFHWFSTMLGVHFFASGLVTALCVLALTLIVLRGLGKLHGCFTEEHMHDLGKLVFGFNVFWAYIAFSQYFLIWYANIPEETMFFDVRKGGEWKWVSIAVPVVHFIIPFLLLLPRPSKRNPMILATACIIILAGQVLDTWWMIRPEAVSADGVRPGLSWIDVVGIAGPLLILIGFYVRKVASGPLIPLHDPRQPQALSHTNHI
ncbi:MAG: hypothetical protein Tsb0013_10600 [Phycisphaerales bacterium]